MPVALQMRMARAALQLSVRDVAEKAKVSPNTVTKIESGEEVRPATMLALQHAFETAGIEFLGDDGVRLKRKGKR